jgi:uncharacterized membrane protein
MNRQLNFIKTTAIGGFVFLIPAVIVVILFGKLIGGLKTLAKALAPIFGIESSFGGFTLDIAAFAVTILICFAAGILAKRAAAKRAREKLDRSLLNFIPGYAFVKGFADNIRQTEEISSSFVPVTVRFDDYVQMGFETEQLPNGKVAIYLPGAQNPWSGSVVFVSNDRIKRLSISLPEALRNIRTLGKGSLNIEGLGDRVKAAQTSTGKVEF